MVNDTNTDKKRTGIIISVIVPAYNVEKYIGNTIEDIRNQTYPNLEIIIVDDGSTDLTLEICKQKEKNDSRIIVITKENGGAASARNVGLDAATGDYVGFVDADDRIDPQMYEFLVKTAEENNSDVVACTYREEYGDNLSVVEHNDENYEVIHFRGRQECMFSINRAKKGTLAFLWNKIYRKSLTSGIRFFEDMKIFEDYLFNYCFMYNAENVERIDIPLYHYRYVTTSLTKTSQPKTLLYDLSRIEELIYWTKNNAPKCTDNLIRKYLFFNAKALETMFRNYNPVLYKQFQNNIFKFQEYIKTLPSWKKFMQP